MTHICSNHELGRGMILQNFYGRFSNNDRSMLDTSSSISFMKRSIEFKWDLLERIKHNSEDWETDKGNESSINLEFDCVKSFVETYVFMSLAQNMDLILR